MKTVSEAIALASKFLKEKGIERSRRLAEEIFSFALKLKRIDLYMQYDRPLNEEELCQIREPLARCAKNEPFEYISKEVEFFGCPLFVDQRVLIPRQETEILASLISKTIDQEATLWDLCTGSGCLGLSLKKHHPNLNVTLSDLSEEALVVAKMNAEKNKLDVQFRLGDLFAPFQEGEKTDLIVCNPPYVREEEWGQLSPSVKDFEPKTALVAPNDGLYFYQKIALHAPKYLNPKGKLWIEIGSSQKEAVQAIFNGGFWSKIQPIQDWAGKDRFFFLEKG